MANREAASWAANPEAYPEMTCPYRACRVDTSTADIPECLEKALPVGTTLAEGSEAFDAAPMWAEAALAVAAAAMPKLTAAVAPQCLAEAVEMAIAPPESRPSWCREVPEETRRNWRYARTLKTRFGPLL